MKPLRLLLICFAGWMNRRQQLVIEYLQEEIRVLREQLGTRPRFNENQRRRLAAKGKPIGRKGLARLAGIVTPDTLLAWHRRLIAQKYDSSKKRNPGRPATAADIRELGWRTKSSGPNSPIFPIPARSARARDSAVCCATTFEKPHETASFEFLDNTG